MKVFDIRCHSGHLFEGWFDSDDDFQSQKKRGILLCPVCDSHEVEKMPSAVRMLSSGAQESAQPREETQAVSPSSSALTQQQAASLSAHDISRLQAQWLQALRQVVQQTEDVGTRFAQEVRSMHAGDIEERPIRGQTTWKETQELLEEGIDVLPILNSDAIKSSLH